MKRVRNKGLIRTMSALAALVGTLALLPQKSYAEGNMVSLDTPSVAQADPERQARDKHLERLSQNYIGVPEITLPSNAQIDSRVKSDHFSLYKGKDSKGEWFYLVPNKGSSIDSTWAISTHIVNGFFNAKGNQNARKYLETNPGFVEDLAMLVDHNNDRYIRVPEAGSTEGRFPFGTEKTIFNDQEIKVKDLISARSKDYND